SYLEGLKLGFLTQDPAAVHDSNMCVPYMNSTTNSTSSRYTFLAKVSSPPNIGWCGFETCRQMSYHLDCTDSKPAEGKFSLSRNTP
ncbi:hypothetical protein BD769DRAFT_1367733, partial [Suillus cothurnatus]